MFETVVVPLGTITIVAGLSGLLLSVADKFFALPVDELFTAVREALPSVNCGACGYAGCDAYAQALSSGDEKRANLCTPGGKPTADAVASILGLEDEAPEPRIAFVKCQGNLKRAGHTADYRGLETCKSAKMVSGGETRCSYGCMGFGDCVKVCPYDAIYVHEGIAFVDPDYCTGCTLCVPSCPLELIEMRPRSAEYYVCCSSNDKGAVARKKCTVACIGCGLCVKVCPVDAITMTDHLAHINPDICINCGACEEKCPTKAIVHLKLDEDAQATA
jgi:electron transport complex protein RnfB